MQQRLQGMIRYLSVLEDGGKVWEIVERQDADTHEKHLDLRDAQGRSQDWLEKADINQFTDRALAYGLLRTLRKPTAYRERACEWLKHVFDPTQDMSRFVPSRIRLEIAKMARNGSSLAPMALPMKFAVDRVCSECPWRKDLPNPSRFGARYWTTVSEGRMGCVQKHVREPHACAGWLLREGAKSPAVVTACVRGVLNMDRVRKQNQQTESGLFADFQEMCAYYAHAAEMNHAD